MPIQNKGSFPHRTNKKNHHQLFLFLFLNAKIYFMGLEIKRSGSLCNLSMYQITYFSISGSY